jgi:hypothetical protein
LGYSLYPATRGAGKPINQSKPFAVRRFIGPVRGASTIPPLLAAMPTQGEAKLFVAIAPINTECTYPMTILVIKQEHEICAAFQKIAHLLANGGKPA